MNKFVFALSPYTALDKIHRKHGPGVIISLWPVCGVVWVYEIGGERV
jgi:hypothetical protein